MERAAVTGMAQNNWKAMLDSLSKLLNRCSSEELVLQLLKVTLLTCSASHSCFCFVSVLTSCGYCSLNTSNANQDKAEIAVQLSTRVAIATISNSVCLP